VIGEPFVITNLYLEHRLSIMLTFGEHDACRWVTFEELWEMV